MKHQLFLYMVFLHSEFSVEIGSERSVLSQNALILGFSS